MSLHRAKQIWLLCINIGMKKSAIASLLFLNMYHMLPNSCDAMAILAEIRPLTIMHFAQIVCFP